MKNLPIKIRLYLSLGAMLSLLILVAGANILYIHNINKKLTTISETAFPAAASSLNLKLAMHRVMDVLNAAAIASRKDILEDMPALEVQVFAQLNELKAIELV